MISHLIEATELIARLDDPNCIVIDASWYLPAMQRDPDEAYRRVCIPGAARFDLDRWSDHSSPYPATMSRLRCGAERTLRIALRIFSISVASAS